MPLQVINDSVLKCFSYEPFSYEGLKFVKDDTNLLDLFELCDIALTLNSGVGVYAILANKPCMLCANAFYHFEGLNLQAKDEKELERTF